MKSVVRPSSFALALVAFVGPLPLLAAQYVPIRDLDPGALYAGKETARIRSGVAVGSGDPGTGRHGLVWDTAGIHELDNSFFISAAFPQDVRSNGDVVGRAYPLVGGTPSMAVIWQAGTPFDLNSLVTGGSKLYLHSCYGIDRHGRICGGLLTSPGTGHGFLFDQGFVTDLGALPGGRSSIALAMNDHQEEVGYSSVGAYFHAVLFDGTGVHDLHDPTQITGPGSEAADIDRFGRIAGQATFKLSTGGFRQSMVMWDHGLVTDLGAGLSRDSAAHAMNDFGDVVGDVAAAPFGTRAILFHAGTAIRIATLIDPTLGWTLITATGIDNEGRIVGTGLLNGSWAAWILEPVCLGTFTPYGTGCAGTGGLEPVLAGTGCPAPDRDFALAIEDGLPNALGFFFAGTGTNTIQVRPGCDLQVVPLLIPPVAIALDGFGEWWNQQHLPAGTPTFDVNLQALFFDPGAAHGISATKAVTLHFQ